MTFLSPSFLNHQLHGDCTCTLAFPDNAGTQLRQNGMVEAIEQNRSNPAESSSSTAIPYYCSMILNARYRLRNASILTSFSCSHTTQYRTSTSTCTVEACTVQYLYLYSYQYLQYRYEYLYRYEYIYGMQELNFAEIIIPVVTIIHVHVPYGTGTHMIHGTCTIYIQYSKYSTLYTVRLGVPYS